MLDNNLLVIPYTILKIIATITNPFFIFQALRGNIPITLSQFQPRAPIEILPCRGPNPGELKATTVLSLKIEEGAAKIRAADANDDPRDHQLNHWAGIVPIIQSIGEAIPAGDLKAGIEVPASVAVLREKYAMG